MKHRLYKSPTRGPAVFLCHELPGLYDKDIELAKHLADFGFTVHVPLFFGKAQSNHVYRYGVTQCLNLFSEFACLVPGSSRAVQWVEPLLDEAFATCGGKGVGVVGMCLTGSFPLALMGSKVLKAAVACQPTSPFFFKSRLDISKDQEMAARTSSVEVLGLKFSEDAKSPDSKWNTMRGILRDRLIECTIDSSNHNSHGIRHNAHSILAGQYDNTPGAPTYEALQVVLRFLDNRLSANPVRPPFPRAGEACPMGFKVFNNRQC